MIYSTRGVVEWLIKHEAKPSALSATRTLLECCKSRTARPSARINWLIVTLPDLDRHLLVSPAAAFLFRQTVSDSVGLSNFDLSLLGGLFL